jgi:hypothetical protein
MQPNGRTKDNLNLLKFEPAEAGIKKLLKVAIIPYCNSVFVTVRHFYLVLKFAG